MIERRHDLSIAFAVAVAVHMAALLTLAFVAPAHPPILSTGPLLPVILDLKLETEARPAAVPAPPAPAVRPPAVEIVPPAPESQRAPAPAPVEPPSPKVAPPPREAALAKEPESQHMPLPTLASPPIPPAAPAPEIAAAVPARSIEGNSAPAVSATVPSFLAGVRVQYPTAARRRGEEGTARLRLTVDSSGRVQDVTVVESTGYPALDAAATAAARKARLAPATENGQPVSGAVELTVRFKLID